MYRIYGISTPKKIFLEDFNNIRLQDPLRCPSLEKAEIYGKRTDEVITNLETSAHASHRNSGSYFLAMQFGFGPS